MAEVDIFNVLPRFTRSTEAENPRLRGQFEIPQAENTLGVQARSYMGSVEGPRLTDCQELHQISQIRLDGDLSQISLKPVFDLTD
jgi:hypothetical protein